MTYVSRKIIEGAYPLPEPRRLTFYAQKTHVRDQLILQLAATTDDMAAPLLSFLRKMDSKSLDRFQYIEFDLTEYNTLVSVSTANPSNGAFHYTIDHLQEPPPSTLRSSSWLAWLGFKS